MGRPGCRCPLSLVAAFLGSLTANDPAIAAEKIKGRLSSTTTTARPATATPPADERAGGVAASAPDVVLDQLHGQIAASACAVGPQARDALAALSWFPAKPNTFSRAAADAVAGRPGTAAVDDLVRAGLVELVKGGRLTVHQAVVDYGRADLANPGRRRAARRRLFDFYFPQRRGRIAGDPPDLGVDYLNVIEALRCACEEGWDPEFVTAVNIVAPQVLARGLYQVPNVYHFLIAAEHLAGYGLPKVLAQLTLVHVYEKAGEHGLAAGLLTQCEAEAAASATPIDPGVRGQVHLARAALAFSRCEYKACEQALSAAIAAAAERAPADDTLLSDAAQRRVAVALSVGRSDDAARWLIDGWRATCRLPASDLGRRSGMYLAAGLFMLHADHASLAERDLEVGLRLAVDGNHPERVTAIRHLLAVVRHRRNDPSISRVTELIDAAEQSAAALGHRWYLAAVACERGELELRSGRAASASAAFSRALQLCPEGSCDRRAFAQFGMARAAALGGDTTHAASLARQSYESFAGIGHHQAGPTRFWLVALLMDLAESHYRDRRLDDAAATFAEVMTTADSAQADQIAFAEFGLARVAFARGDVAGGVRDAQSSLGRFAALRHEKVADVYELLGHFGQLAPAANEIGAPLRSSPTVFPESPTAGTAAKATVKATVDLPDGPPETRPSGPPVVQKRRRSRAQRPADHARGVAEGWDADEAGGGSIPRPVPVK